RPEVWKYLLGVYPWEANECERKEILNKKRYDTYWSIKQKWMDSTVRESEDFKEQSFRIEKDVLRTDRHIPLFSENEEDEHVESNLPQSNANLEQLKDILICYHFYNPSLGYVQGMSDLLSPIFAVMQDEVETFWCFVAFMDKVKTNFSRDQQGMHGQLTTLSLLIKLIAPTLHLHLVDISADNMFMCFRWLLIWFKREFSFDNIMRIWEIIWTNHLTKHYHLFIAAAILEMHQHVIAAHLHSLEEVLRYINDLSNVIDYRGILKRAELMFREFETRMAAFHKSENQERNSSGEMLPLLGGTNTPLIITPPPEIHSYTVSPSSPASGPSTILLTTEEFKKLEFLLEK
ncbi:RabGAP/TBC, partial [Neoconidiobolus thromboides FSU 785]